MNNPYFALWMLGLGALFFGIGLLHRRPALAQWDTRSLQTLYIRLERFSPLFRFIWPLGTTPVCVVLLAIIYIVSWPAGAVASLLYVAAATIERITKLNVRRARPFQILPGIQALQPTLPEDPSYPSGDALRVWFLAITFPAAFELPWPVTLLTCSIAVILSLGRIALGAHYPLDVIGGTGLGLLGAGFSILSFQMFVIS